MSSGSSSVSSSSSDRVRVNIFLNDSDEGGKLLSVGAGFTMKQLLEKAQAKFNESADSSSSAAGINVSRCFLENGAEVTDPADLVEGDRLYFSTGAAASDRGANGAGVGGAAPARSHFLSSIASAAVAQASSLYESSSAFVKTHGPPIVKVSLERMEESVKSAAEKYSIKEKVQEYGSPLLTWADDRVDAAYDLVKRRRASLSVFLQSPLAIRVNDTLVKPLRLSLLNQYTQLTENFRQQSEEAFSLILGKVQQGKERVGDLRQQADKFVIDMRTRLGVQWSEKLSPLARQFYQVVVTEYEILIKKADASKIQLQEIFHLARERLGKTWEEQVTLAYQNYSKSYEFAYTVYTEKVKDPVAAFYIRSLEVYKALEATSAQGKVTMQEFAAGLRVRMGELWNDQLYEPASKLLESFQASAAASAAAANNSSSSASAVASAAINSAASNNSESKNDAPPS